MLNEVATAVFFLPQPYDGESDAYQSWRQQRLQVESARQAPEFFRLQGTQRPDPGMRDSPYDDLDRLCAEVKQHGFALYQFDDYRIEKLSTERQRVARFFASLGLQNGDSGVITGSDQLSLLENSADEKQRRFVPYSDRAMNWHTDGYYNTSERSVRCFCLHCLAPAHTGGELTLMDDELLLIALYDHGPDVVSLLAHPEAMLIPESRDELGHDRPDRVLPVLDVDAKGRLLTRFTTRQRNIHWRTPETKAAAEVASHLINQQTQWQVTVRLEAGQGVVTRNILHCRTGFVDQDANRGRKMLRGRYQQMPVSSGQPHTTNRNQV